jgi:hypothetical protein
VRQAAEFEFAPGGRRIGSRQRRLDGGGPRSCIDARIVPVRLALQIVDDRECGSSCCNEYVLSLSRTRPVSFLSAAADRQVVDGFRDHNGDRPVWWHAEGIAEAESFMRSPWAAQAAVLRRCRACGGCGRERLRADRRRLVLIGSWHRRLAAGLAVKPAARAVSGRNFHWV